MRKLASCLAVVAVPLLSGCYHATVDTGLRPSGETIEKPWAHSFLGGLVPPETIETASRCPNGVAKVETKHRFLNMVASAVTWGIYSPITIIVQCAAAPGGAEAAALTVPAGASAADAARVFEQAVAKSRESNDAVLLRFE